jgi:hypothetical protein
MYAVDEGEPSDASSCANTRVARSNARTREVNSSELDDR